MKHVVTDPVHMADVLVKPQQLESGLAEADLHIVNASRRKRTVVLEVSVEPADNADQTVVSQRTKRTVPPGPSNATLKWQIRDAAPWSPANPHLYVTKGATTMASNSSRCS